MDRRGRGESGDGTRYHLRREGEDIAAILQRIGEPTAVLGHSYGALCALEASLVFAPDKLILYEPPLGNTSVRFHGEGIVNSLKLLLDAGEYEAVLVAFLLEIARVSTAELNLMRSLPSWADRVEAAHTIPRELLSQETYWLNPEVERMHVPTLLMLGSDSPALFKNGIDQLAIALPNPGIVALPGQRHVAMDTAPDLFVEMVLAFLTRDNSC